MVRYFLKMSACACAWWYWYHALVFAVLLGGATVVWAQQDQRDPQGLQPSQDQQAWTVNFKDADISELIQFIAEVTDKTFIIDPKVKGEVDVISTTPLNRRQLYNLFLSILEVQGFTAIESGGVVRIVALKDARSSPVVVRSDGRPDESSEIITQVIQLNNVSAAKLIPVLRPLVPQQAHMAAYTPSNAVIVSDTAANIARIHDIIKSIDRAAVTEVAVIKLNYAMADDVVAMLEKLQKNDASKAQLEFKPLQIVADKRTNSILVSGDEIERQRIASLVSYLDTPLVDAGNVKVVYLKYAQAVQLAQVLTSIVANVEKLASPLPATNHADKTNTAIEADEDTNALIITADSETMQSILAIIQRLDIRRAQVLVEAIIVELSDEDTRQLGLQWLFLSDSGAYGSSSTGSGLTAAGFLIEDEPALFGAVLAETKGQLVGVGRLSSQLNFNVVLNALNENIDANILSTPTLLTMDNHEASIVVGQNVPFETGSYTSVGDSSNPNNPFTTIERQNVGITLRVTPQINEGEMLVLTISQEVSSLTGTAIAVDPATIVTNERKIDTKVLVSDGEMIVLGGLIKDDVQQTVQKIPLLGDIPWLGRLFRNDGTKVTKQHLMVFLRAQIMRDDEAIAGATAEKYRFMRNAQREKMGDAGLRLFSDEELPLLPEWKRQLEVLAHEHP